MTFDANATVNNVVALKRKPSEPTLKEILKNEDVREFFKFVHENDLRIAAHEAIKMKLEENK